MSEDACYCPAIVRSEHDSVFDALLALDVPRDEAMDLMVSRWGQPGGAILATVFGGRSVIAVPLGQGRWAACTAYPEQCSHSLAEAERGLEKLIKRLKNGKRGLVAALPAGKE